MRSSQLLVVVRLLPKHATYNLNFDEVEVTCLLSPAVF